MVVGEPGQPRLGREVAGAPGERLVVGHQHPAAAGGDELVAVEAEAADPPDRADLAAGVAALAVGRAERLGRVLDHRHAVALGGVDHRLEVGRMAQQVHDLDRRGLPDPGPRPPVQLRRDQRRIEVVGLPLRVDEDGRRARVPHRVGRGDEGEAGDDDLVAGADVEHEHREVDRRRPRRAGDGVAGPDEGGERLLEPGDERPDRRDEVRAEALVEVAPRVAPDRRLGERDPRLRAGHGSRP